MPTEPQQTDIVAEARELSWSRYYKLVREYAASQYGLRRVRVDTWKEYWATGVPFTHAARLVNETKNPRYEP